MKHKFRLYYPAINNSILIVDVIKLGISHNYPQWIFSYAKSTDFLWAISQKVQYTSLQPYTFAICDLLGLNELFFVECCVSFVGAPWMVHKRLFPGGVLEIQKVV